MQLCIMPYAGWPGTSACPEAVVVGGIRMLHPILSNRIWDLSSSQHRLSVLCLALRLQTAACAQSC